MADCEQGALQVGDGIEGSDCETQVVGGGRQVDQILVAEAPVGGRGEQRSRIQHGDVGDCPFEECTPCRIGAADQQRIAEFAPHIAEPVEAVVERPLEEEEGRAAAGGAVAAERPCMAIEQRLSHMRACAMR